MKSLSKNNGDYPELLRALFLSLAAGFTIALLLVLIGLVTYYSRLYNWQ